MMEYNWLDALVVSVIFWSTVFMFWIISKLERLELEGDRKMGSQLNKEAIKLMHEIDFVDRSTLELKEEIQYKGCPFCEVDDGEFIENSQTRQALFYKFKRCNNCSLIYAYPRLNRDTLESKFKSDEYSKTSEEKSKNFDRKNEIERVLCYSYQEFKRFAKKGYRILDVGAGYGAVARQLLEKGCIVEAVELNPYRANYIRERLGIKVYEESFEKAQLQQSTYDVVIFSQVLMHLFSIKKTIQKVRYVLRPGGLIISSQMNFNSIVQQTIRSPYPGKGLTAFSICSWFTPKSLKTILEKSGFEVIKVMFRPNNLFGYFFPQGYPGGYLTRFLLKAIEQILKIILIRTGTSDYFSIIAKKVIV